MFTEKSRYKDSGSYLVEDGRGRQVSVVPLPDPPDQAPLGIHLRREGQHTDHLAKKYLNDAAGFWRLCDANDKMLPEALSETDEVVIPRVIG